MKSIEAEQSVLGCILVEGFKAAELINQLTVDHFSNIEHQQIFAAIKELADNAKRIDIISVQNANKDMPMDLLINLAESLCDISAGISYADILDEGRKMRALLIVANSIYEQANEKLSSDSIIHFVQDSLLSLTSKNNNGVEKISHALKRVAKNLQERMESDEMSGTETGYQVLDKASDGLQDQTLSVLSGVPGSGKTTLAMKMAMNAAKTKPVAVFSIEMGMDQLTKRMISSLGSIDMAHIMSGNLQGDDFTNLHVAVKAGLTYDKNLIIDCSPSITPTYIRMKCNEIRMKYGDLGLVVIDYFMLIDRPNGSTQLDASTMNAIAINRLKKELDCPILLLAQMNKDTVKTGRKANQGDLDWGQQLARDADNIFFLHTNEQLIEDKVVNFYSAKTRDMNGFDYYLSNMLKFNRLDEINYVYQEPVQSNKGPTY